MKLTSVKRVVRIRKKMMKKNNRRSSMVQLEIFWSGYHMKNHKNNNTNKRDQMMFLMFRNESVTFENRRRREGN